MREHTQYPDKVNVWAQIVADHVISTFSIDGNLSGNNYLALLQNNILSTLTNHKPQVPVRQPKLVDAEARIVGIANTFSRTDAPGASILDISYIDIIIFNCIGCKIRRFFIGHCYMTQILQNLFVGKNISVCLLSTSFDLARYMCLKICIFTLVSIYLFKVTHVCQCL